MFFILCYYFDVYNRIIGLVGGNVKKKVDILVYYCYQKYVLKRVWFLVLVIILLILVIIS